MSSRQSSRAALVAAVGSIILTAAASAQLGNTGGTGSSSMSGSSAGRNNAPVVVPLPGAALAGLGTLAGVIGLSVLRRRRHNQA